MSGGGGRPGGCDSLCERSLVIPQKFEACILCDGKPGAAVPFVLVEVCPSRSAKFVRSMHLAPLSSRIAAASCLTGFRGVRVRHPESLPRPARQGFVAIGLGARIRVRPLFAMMTSFVGDARPDEPSRDARLAVVLVRVCVT